MPFKGHCYVAQTRRPFKGHLLVTTQHWRPFKGHCYVAQTRRPFKGHLLVTTQHWRPFKGHCYVAQTRRPFKGHFFHFQVVHSICCLITCIRCLHETGPKGLELCQQHVFAFAIPFSTPEWASYFKNWPFIFFCSILHKS